LHAFLLPYKWRSKYSRKCIWYIESLIGRWNLALHYLFLYPKTNFIIGVQEGYSNSLTLAPKQFFTGGIPQLMGEKYILIWHKEKEYTLPLDVNNVIQDHGCNLIRSQSCWVLMSIVLCLIHYKVTKLTTLTNQGTILMHSTNKNFLIKCVLRIVLRYE